MYTDLSLTQTPPTLGETLAVAGDRQEVEQSVAMLELELDGLSKAMAQRFEELSLIHELSDRLCLEEDLGNICEDLLQQLTTCIPARTIAVDLIGDEEDGLPLSHFFVGESLPADVAEAIAKASVDESN